MRLIVDDDDVMMGDLKNTDAFNNKFIQTMMVC